MIRCPVSLSTLDRAAADLAADGEDADTIASVLQGAYPAASRRDIVQAADRAVGRRIRRAA